MTWIQQLNEHTPFENSEKMFRIVLVYEWDRRKKKQHTLYNTLFIESLYVTCIACAHDLFGEVPNESIMNYIHFAELKLIVAFLHDISASLHFMNTLYYGYNCMQVPFCWNVTLLTLSSSCSLSFLLLLVSLLFYDTQDFNVS